MNYLRNPYEQDSLSFRSYALFILFCIFLGLCVYFFAIQTHSQTDPQPLTSASPTSDHACLPLTCHIIRPTPSAASRSRITLPPRPLRVPSISRPPVAIAEAGLPIALQKIRTCESGDLHSLNSYNYRMQDPTSTASGAFGFLRSTWDNWGGYSQAKYAPPSVQNAKAIATYHLVGTRPWSASQPCWSQL